MKHFMTHLVLYEKRASQLFPQKFPHLNGLIGLKIS